MGRRTPLENAICNLHRDLSQFLSLRLTVDHFLGKNRPDNLLNRAADRFNPLGSFLLAAFRFK
jgi:hypothetical protein